MNRKGIFFLLITMEVINPFLFLFYAVHFHNIIEIKSTKTLSTNSLQKLRTSFMNHHAELSIRPNFNADLEMKLRNPEVAVVSCRVRDQQGCLSHLLMPLLRWPAMFLQQELLDGVII